jgi:hypothetical protein
MPDGGAYFAGDLKVGGSVTAASFPTFGAGLYQALMTQVGTTAPTVKVLSNSLSGSISWAYTVTGTYTGTLTGAFTANKTACRINADSSNSDTIATIGRTDADSVTVKTLDASAAALTNSLLADAFLEIIIVP